jgi:hypothetical protein
MPFSIFYCQSIIERDDNVEIFMEYEGSIVSEIIYNYEYYNIYKGSKEDEEKLIDVFTQFQSYLDNEIKGALKNDE